jgi:hypothetical protein
MAVLNMKLLNGAKFHRLKIFILSTFNRKIVTKHQHRALFFRSHISQRFEKPMNTFVSRSETLQNANHNNIGCKYQQRLTIVVVVGVVLRVSLPIIDIDRSVVTGDQQLQLIRRKHIQPSLFHQQMQSSTNIRFRIYVEVVWM